MNINAGPSILNLLTLTLPKENNMSESLKDAVIQAVFHRQLETKRAVGFIMRETGVSAKEAGTALKLVLTRRG